MRELRELPMWRLLCADKAPLTLGLMQVFLLEEAKTLGASVLLERLQRELVTLRDAGEDMPQSAQAYIAEWLSRGWLSRRFPADAPEEVYELTTEAVTALRFLLGVMQPRQMATESRLALVIQQLARLAEETDDNPRTRLQALQAERARIDREIERVSKGHVDTLPPERALERAREIIALSDELTGDFRRVRDQFGTLNRNLRESLLDNEGSRGDVLEALFEGVDVISSSDEGKTFAAFWRLLTNPNESSTLSQALEDVMSRPFASSLTLGERRFLRNLTTRLIGEGKSVHEVLQHFASGLKAFVQSKEYLEQRRFNTLLKTAQREALVAKDFVQPNRSVQYELTLTSSSLGSVSRWRLLDPEERVADATMAEAQPAAVSLEMVSELVRQSDIDFNALQQNIHAMLQRQDVVRIDELLDAFPAEQGLGSVVGYLALGAKSGTVTDTPVRVGWVGSDAQPRHATVPTVFFVKEKEDEFAS